MSAALTVGARRDSGSSLSKRRSMASSSSTARIARVDPQQEPVELGLGQREGALQLDRVLGGQHQERLRQAHGLPVHGHLPLLHGLEQGRLGPGRGPVDLVGQQHLGEDGSGPEAELRRALIEHARTGHVGGQHVGRELHPAKGAAHGGGQRPGQQRLAHARARPRSGRARGTARPPAAGRPSRPCRPRPCQSPAGSSTGRRRNRSTCLPLQVSDPGANAPRPAPTGGMSRGGGIQLRAASSTSTEGAK